MQSTVFLVLYSTASGKMGVGSGNSKLRTKMRSSGAPSVAWQGKI
jgi:hypothetical protein